MSNLKAGCLIYYYGQLDDLLTLKRVIHVKEQQKDSEKPPMENCAQQDPDKHKARTDPLSWCM